MSNPDRNQVIAKAIRIGHQLASRECEIVALLTGGLGDRKTSTNPLCEWNAWLDHLARVLAGEDVDDSYKQYCDDVDECNNP